MRYDVVVRYADSLKAGDQATTNSQRVEVICRVLDLFCRDYGVRVSAAVIEGITPAVVGGFYDSLASSRKASTVNYYVSLLRPFFRWAYERDVLSGCDKQSFEKISGILRTKRLPQPEMVPEDERTMKYISHEQARELLEHPAGRNVVRDRAIIAMILYSGLRVSELCSLTLSSVLDRPRGEVYVRRKGGKWASVMVNPLAYAYLDAYLATRDLSDRSQPLFMTTHGKPCNRKQLYMALSFKQKAVGAASGAHALRHSFVSEADKAGGASVARDLAGQSSLRITNRYDHTTPEQRRRAIDKIEW